MIPRALRSRPRAMARPARPLAEVVAVRAAAEIVRAEIGLESAKALGKEIARRVTEQMLTDAERDPAAAVLAFLAKPDPITTLAFSDAICTCDELADRFRALMRPYGAFIPPLSDQVAKRRAAALALRETLAQRYARHLGSAQ